MMTMMPGIRDGADGNDGVRLTADYIFGRYCHGDSGHETIDLRLRPEAAVRFAGSSCSRLPR